MFCPKCGTENPESGKFCRSCGTDLGNVTDALSGKLRKSQAMFDKKGKPISYEGAITKIFTGIAFLIVAIVLGITGAAGGKVWWFWMLIPAFGSLGAGVAQYVQLKKEESGYIPIASPDDRNILTSNKNAALPPPKTEFVAPESKYKTGDLVPPSVTDGTTKLLELDSEGKTMTLPKR
ncbi:MAG: zinc-ribbon domain-containing protein [Saprospiraceae bacterium]|nr:zinc-ribbon domain-containing protein [Pyrinomonadaceae bacterium]